MVELKKNFADLFSAKHTLIGEWISTSSCVTAELSAAAGVDFLVLDNEHAGWGGDNNISLVRSADAMGVPAIVRITELGPTPIKQALDMGATGIMVPDVSTPQEAEDAVRYARFAPQGTRGACPYTRANNYGVIDLNEYYDRANRDMAAVILLIEGREGIENLDAILAVPGIHSVMVGPVDLSCSLGIPGDVDNVLVKNAVVQTIRKCREYGVHFMAQSTSAKEAIELLNYGADSVLISDLMLLADATKETVRAIRKEDE